MALKWYLMGLLSLLSLISNLVKYFSYAFWPFVYFYLTIMLDLFLDSLSHSIDLYVYPYAKNTYSWLMNIYSKS